MTVDIVDRDGERVVSIPPELLEKVQAAPLGKDEQIVYCTRCHGFRVVDRGGGQSNVVDKCYACESNKDKPPVAVFVTLGQAFSANDDTVGSVQSELYNTYEAEV